MEGDPESGSSPPTGEMDHSLLVQPPNEEIIMSMLKSVDEHPCLDKIYNLFKLINDHSGDRRDECYYALFTNLFRLLRNYCACYPSNIDLVETNLGLLSLTCKWLSDNYVSKTKQTNDSPKKLDSIKCLLQFYSNAAAGPPSEKRLIRRFLFQNLNCETDSCMLLDDPNDTVFTVTCAVIYHCLLDSDVLNNFIRDDSYVAGLMNKILLRCHVSEWGLFIVELLLGQSINLKSVIDRCQNHPNHLYDVVLNMVKEDNAKGCVLRITDRNIKIILNLLKEKLDMLSQEMVRDLTEDEIASIANLILIACEVSSNEINQADSLNDEDLYKNTIGALKRIHILHKAKALKDKESDQNSGLASLKRDLVRLVANLTHNRPHLQLIASQIDAVPLMLDLCSFDMNNPFIREWATYATRNLLYNCQENIQIVREIKDLNIAADPHLMNKLNLNVIDGKLVPKISKDSKQQEDQPFTKTQLHR